MGSEEIDNEVIDSNAYIDKNSDQVISTNAVDSSDSMIFLDTTEHYLDNEILEIGDTNFEQSSRAVFKKSEKVVDKSENHSETPEDAVYVPSQKHLSNTQFVKTSVEVTEATKSDENNKLKVESNTEPVLAPHTMNYSMQNKYS